MEDVAADNTNEQNDDFGGDQRGGAGFDACTDYPIGESQEPIGAYLVCDGRPCCLMSDGGQNRFWRMLEHMDIPP
jgi:hypothetical protein